MKQEKEEEFAKNATAKWLKIQFAGKVCRWLYIEAGLSFCMSEKWANVLDRLVRMRGGKNTEWTEFLSGFGNWTSDLLLLSLWRKNLTQLKSGWEAEFSNVL